MLKYLGSKEVNATVTAIFLYYPLSLTISLSDTSLHFPPLGTWGLTLAVNMPYPLKNDSLLAEENYNISIGSNKECLSLSKSNLVLKSNIKSIFILKNIKSLFAEIYHRILVTHRPNNFMIRIPVHFGILYD